MFDVRDLEVPVERGAVAAAPVAVRAACALMLSLVALILLRAWMVLFEWRQFQHTWGQARGLDMGTPAGWAQAELYTPGEWTVLLDAFLVLGIGLALIAVVHRFSEARGVVVVLAAFLAVDALAPLALSVPWWFAVASSMLAGYALLLVALMLRATTRMHVRPEPLTLHEAIPRPRPSQPRADPHS